MRRSVFALICAVMLLAGQSSSSADPPETADVMDQGGVTVLASDGARLVRQTDGVGAAVAMPAPTSGTYVYPDGTEPGHPEVFTLWMFVFNFPEHCSQPCDFDDTMDPDVQFGVYNVAGHVNAGSVLNLSGRIGIGEPAGAPPNVVPHPLVNPAGAEIHLAVTSHGGLDSATLPGEFKVPTGSPFCGCWWVAIFD